MSSLTIAIFSAMGVAILGTVIIAKDLDNPKKISRDSLMKATCMTLAGITWYSLANMTVLAIIKKIKN